MEARSLMIIAAVILVFLYALGSGLFMDNSGWYQSLNRPQWQPPDIVFGLIWPYNFLILGISAVTVMKSGELGRSVIFLVFLTASICSALSWAYFFYKPHDLTLASIALGLAATLTIPLVVLTFQKNTLVGLLLMPYQGWLITATLLSVSYSRLN